MCIAFFVRRNPLNACVQKDEDEQKSGLAEQGLFGRRDACGSRGIFNPHFVQKDEDEQKSGLAEQGLLGRRDACGSRGIFNPHFVQKDEDEQKKRITM